MNSFLLSDSIVAFPFLLPGHYFAPHSLSFVLKVILELLRLYIWRDCSSMESQYYVFWKLLSPPQKKQLYTNTIKKTWSFFGDFMFCLPFFITVASSFKMHRTSEKRESMPVLSGTSYPTHLAIPAKIDHHSIHVTIDNELDLFRSSQNLTTGCQPQG